MGKYKNPIPDVEDKREVEDVKGDEIANDYLESKSVYFAFIDILGFKKAFDDNRGKEAAEFSAKFRNVFNYFFELMSAANLMKGNECYAGQTSDSLYFYTTRSDLLSEFLKIFSHFNLYAMAQNVFLEAEWQKGIYLLRKNINFMEKVLYMHIFLRA